MATRADDKEAKSGLLELLGTRRAQFALLLYLLFPVFSGLTSGIQGSGRTSGWPLGFRISYYIPLALIGMWSTGIACHLLSKPLRSVRVPLWVLLILGVLVAGEVMKLYVRLIVPVFDKLLPASATGGRVVEFTFFGNLQAATGSILTWLALNLLAWWVFRIPRFGYPPPGGIAGSRWAAQQALEPDEIARRTPNFLSRANIGSIAEVRAIEAQQHYIKIHAEGRAHTILYRFSDAIGEIDDEVGLQVHRSWWINLAHFTELVRDGDRSTVVLSDGLSVPVSRTFALKVKERLD